MKLSEIMTREVVVIQPDDSLKSAAKKMRDLNIGFLPVCDGENLIGVISDRDITIRALADGMDVSIMLGRDLMTSPAIYCFEDQDVSEAAKIMEENQIRRLVVVSRDDKRSLGRLLGDLARNETPDRSGQILRKVSSRYSEKARMGKLAKINFLFSPPEPAVKSFSMSQNRMSCSPLKRFSPIISILACGISVYSMIDA
jgi:CBS domain-containing protein